MLKSLAKKSLKKTLKIFGGIKKRFIFDISITTKTKKMKTKITFMDYSYFKIYYSDCIFRTFALNAGDALEALQQEMGWEELPVIEGIQQETLNGYISIDMKRKAIN